MERGSHSGWCQIVGRAEVRGRSAHVVSSYSCPTCCPDHGPYGGFDPYAYDLYVSGIASTGSSGEMLDCYGNVYWQNIYWYTITTTNSAVATADSGTYELYGEGVGSTYVVGHFWQIEWEFYESENGGACREWDYYPSDSAPVDVQCSVPTGEISGDVGWSDLDPTMYKYEQTLTPSGNVSFVGRNVTEPDQVEVALTTVINPVIRGMLLIVSLVAIGLLLQGTNGILIPWGTSRVRLAITEVTVALLAAQPSSRGW